MSNRFHNKYHRHNHHTAPTSIDVDSALDPIASPEFPYLGEFHLSGDLVVLDDYSIFCQYEYIVDFIQNRTKDDKCPMEKLTEHIIDPEIAYMQILQFYRKVLKIDLS